MKKILTKLLLLYVMAQVHLYGAFGDKLVNNIKSEVNSTGDMVMSVLHLISGVMGGMMIVVLALAGVFKSELIKDNLKIIITTSIIIGIIWGVTDNGVSVFQ